MIRRAALFILALFISLPLSPILSAQEQKPAATQPAPPKMEPDKLGPHTEQVDPKAYAQVYYVAPSSGSEQGDGSQAKPWASLAKAVSAIADASAAKRYAVLVASGEYKGDTVQMKPHVDLFGGFDAETWARDIQANRSVLDGEGQRRVVTASDQARIDGFTIRNGKVRGHGAGILCDRSSPTISNNTILSNATLAPDDLKGNTLYLQPGNEGGGISCQRGSSPTITNNIIANNSTEIGVGGGIAATNNSLPHILNNVIVDNTSGLTDVNQSRSSSGGGISASHAQTRGESRMTIINNVIAQNKANGTSDAGGIFCEYDSSPIIGANWVLGNQSTDDGGGIYVMKASHPLITSNIIAGNNSSALRLSKEGRGDIEHNLFYGNSMPIIAVSSWMQFKNNTLVDNGGGIMQSNPYAPHLRESVITDNIVTRGGGGAPQFVDDGITGRAGMVSYDEPSVTSSMTFAKAEPGRVINVGGRWGVVKNVSDDRLTAWGDLRAENGGETNVKVWPTYTLAKP